MELSRMLFTSLSFVYRTSFMTTEPCPVSRTVISHGHMLLVNICWDIITRRRTPHWMLSYPGYLLSEECEEHQGLKHRCSPLSDSWGPSLLCFLQRCSSYQRANVSQRILVVFSSTPTYVGIPGHNHMAQTTQGTAVLDPVRLWGSRI